MSAENNTLNIMDYDFEGAGWDTVGSIIGTNGTTDETKNISLLSKHTGTGTDLGLILIRFENTAQTAPVFYLDQLIVSAVITGTSIGYEGGQVWVDTNASNTNTESFVDGTADNPVSTIAAAKTIADNLNIKSFRILPGSAITLAASYSGYRFGTTRRPSDG